MSDPGVFDHLPRAWWFPGMPDYRPQSERYATYARYDLDTQPNISTGLDGSLDWLENVGVSEEWAITADDDGAHTRVQSGEKLGTLLGAHSVDPSFRKFIETPTLQSSIRSSTGCYLDLGDFVTPVAGASGVLCHFLSDQQWVKHWFVYCGEGPEQGVVLASDKPYGFDTEAWFEEEVPREFDALTPSSGEVCADSFEEFLYRLWVENELFFSTIRDDGEMNDQVARYGEQLRA